MQVAIRALIKSYCDTLADQMIEIAGLIDDLKHHRDNQAAALNRALDIVHQITGLSGSMGYPEISVEAAVLEKFIRGFDASGTSPNDAELARLAGLFETMKDLTDKVTPEASALHNADFNRFAVAATGRSVGLEAS